MNGYWWPRKWWDRAVVLLLLVVAALNLAATDYVTGVLFLSIATWCWLACIAGDERDDLRATNRALLAFVRRHMPDEPVEWTDPDEDSYDPLRWDR